MKIRLAASALGLGAFGVIHAYNAVSWHRSGMPLGFSFTFLVYAAGCFSAAYGLARRLYWARCLALGAATVALTELAVGTLLSVTRGPALDNQDIAIGLPQVLATSSLIVGMLGARMRAAFEERPDGPWRFTTKLARLTRAAVVTGVGAAPMLFLMASSAVYRTSDAGRIVSVLAGVAMLVALVLLARAKTSGLFVMALASVAGAFGALRTVTSLDDNPCYASHDWYTSHTMMAAACLVPGVAVGAVTFLAFVPRMLRFVRG